MTTSIEDLNGVKVYSLSGHFDADMVSKVHKEIEELIQGPINRILLDLSDVTYISSAGLRVFLYVAKTMKAKEGLAALCSATENVKRIIELAALNNIIPIYENREKALTTLGVSKVNA